MRVDNWDTKLSNYIVESSNKKFKYGKADCVNFVLGAIEVVTGKKVFDMEYKSIKEAKKIILEFNKKDLLDIARDIAKENNFKEINTSFAKRGDVVFLETDEELGGTMGICSGEWSIFKAKIGQEKRLTNTCNYAWSIE
jgi:ribosomal protein L7Ae-like RNA K-turn-binding protein|tara:strand:- start:405 stop:821 length:417 start_codon:yes stop_codon:yes gene_type:complete